MDREKSVREYEIQTHVTTHEPKRITDEILHLEARSLRNLNKKWNCDARVMDGDRTFIVSKLTT